jgi:hypothetical protein
MALTQEDLAALGQFIDQKIHAAVQQGPAPAEPANRDSLVGRAEVAFDAGPLFYLHLANGTVLQSHDSASTHMADPENGSTQLIIGRYEVPADAPRDGDGK